MFRTMDNSIHFQKSGISKLLSLINRNKFLVKAVLTAIITVFSKIRRKIESLAYLSTHAIMRGCVNRFLLFGIDDDVQVALADRSNCRMMDRRLLDLIPLSPSTDLKKLNLQCSSETEFCFVKPYRFHCPDDGRTYFHSLTKELPSSKASSNANESIGCYMTLYQNRRLIGSYTLL
ncbi:unnamed protein product [Dracunculus medinensis]|uniref:UDENN domain-containing protein n=1 Tax=Dracunculus medinensis TaxID=318479 RepID=A0A158Q550_DRAME|nr:unnamed protein product [Dracunculus medinensis]